MDKGLGMKLKKLRTERGMTQDMVAKILKTTRQRYARMENGQADIPFQDIRMLADIFGISASELTAEDEKERICSVIRYQNPELLQLYGVEKLLALLDEAEEQEKIYYSKQKKTSSEESVPGLQDPDFYDMLRQIQHPAMGNGYQKNLLSMLECAGLEIIRFPLAQELLGILVFNGRKYTLITNSGCVFEEEMRAAAFLAGNLFTRNIKYRQLLYVLTRKNYEEIRQKGNRILDFAEELLVPGYALNYCIRCELQIHPSQLHAIHAAKLQNDFQVSYETIEKALLKENLITLEQVKKIQKGRRYYGEERLAGMLGFSLEYLHKPWNRTKLPNRYVEHVLSNFENGYIPFVQLKKIMDQLQIPVDQLAGLRKPCDDRDNWDDWDDSWES